MKNLNVYLIITLFLHLVKGPTKISTFLPLTYISCYLYFPLTNILPLFLIINILLTFLSRIRLNPYHLTTFETKLKFTGFVKKSFMIFR